MLFHSALAVWSVPAGKKEPASPSCACSFYLSWKIRIIEAGKTFKSQVQLSLQGVLTNPRLSRVYKGCPVILDCAGESKNWQDLGNKSQWNTQKNRTHTLWLSHKIKSFLVFKIAFTHKQLYINYTDTWVLIQYLQKRIQLCNRHLTGTVQSMLIRGHSWSRTSSRIGDSLGFHYLKSCNFVPLLYIKFFTCISNHWLELIILSQSYYNPVKCKTKN